jgi:IS605 OrfB family transposase
MKVARTVREGAEGNVPQDNAPAAYFTVVGDLSQQQMVTKEHAERNKYLNRAVYNDWLLYTFMQLLVYKCVLYGKKLVILDERDTSKTCCRCGHKQDMPLWKRTYHCAECRLLWIETQIALSTF